MTRNKLSLKLACVIPLLLLSLETYPSLAQAQRSQPSSNRVANTGNLAQLQFPDNGEPKGRRRGGTSRRDGCPKLKTPITALVPGEETNNKSFSASTVAEYPSFWVYLPDLPPNLRSGEFVLQDEEGNDIWRTPIALPGKPGAIAISLPPNPQYALKKDLKYHWYFQVYCGEPQNTPEYFYVDAWVQRVALTPNQEKQLGTAKPREYTVYAANNIWYDAITNLAELRRSNSGDRGSVAKPEALAPPQEARVLAEDWTKLLKAVGLEELATAPIVQRYSPEK